MAKRQPIEADSYEDVILPGICSCFVTGGVLCMGYFLPFGFALMLLTLLVVPVLIGLFLRQAMVKTFVFTMTYTVGLLVFPYMVTGQRPENILLVGMAYVLWLTFAMCITLSLSEVARRLRCLLAGKDRELQDESSYRG